MCSCSDTDIDPMNNTFTLCGLYILDRAILPMGNVLPLIQNGVQ